MHIVPAPIADERGLTRWPGGCCSARDSTGVEEGGERMTFMGEERETVGTGVSQRRIRILFLAANPSSTQQLALANEVRQIDEKLRAARYRDRFELISRWAVRPDDLMQALLEVEPDVVHFSGHGEQDEILLEDESGNPFPVGSGALANLFGVLTDRICLVVLNACYSLSQAQALVEHISCAVGMQRAIGDRAAIEFSSGFYQGLAFGRSIGKAFDIGKANMLLKGIEEGTTPQILTSMDVDPHGLFLPLHPGQPSGITSPSQVPPAMSAQGGMRRIAVAPPTELPSATSGAGRTTRSVSARPAEPPAATVTRGPARAPRREGPYSIALVELDVPDLYPLVTLLARKAATTEAEAASRLEAARAYLESAPRRVAPPVVVSGLDQEQARELLAEIAGLGAVGTARGPREPPYLPNLERAPSGLLMANIPGSDDGSIKPFQMACHPATQAIYRRLMDCNPSRFRRGETRPVEGVTREDALRLCEVLSAHDQSGAHYRLPTEEEWEHAANAGERHRYAGSSQWPEVAWARMAETRPVGKKKPNAWGLFDMSGLVWEWTSTGVLKGGSYASTERDLAIVARLESAPVDHQGVGVRPVRDLP